MHGVKNISQPMHVAKTELSELNISLTLVPLLIRYSAIVSLVCAFRFYNAGQHGFCSHNSLADLFARYDMKPKS